MGRFVNPDNSAFQKAVNSEIYVDKTGFLSYTNKVIDTKQAFICNSRPRRFGKSTTADMLAAYYSKGCDSENLFADLAVSDTEDFHKYLNKYDVIHFDVQWFITENNISEIVNTIQNNIVEELKKEYPDILDSDVTGLPDAMSIINQETGNRFIVIIDEWDVLIRDEAQNHTLQEAYIDFLRGMFKGTEPSRYIALAYLTGILPIKKLKTQSALNNFEEFTMLDAGRMAPYVGFTEEEVHGLCEQYGCSYEQVKSWYDGYLLEDYQVYNPKAVVSVMLNGKYKSYWSNTGSYEAIVPLINMDFDGLKSAMIEMLSGASVEVDVTSFQNDTVSFANRDDVLTYLIHLGYLAYDQDSRHVFIPNEEIRHELNHAVKRTSWNEMMTFQKESLALLDATLEKDGMEVAKGIEKIHTGYSSTIMYHDENSLSSVLTIAYLSSMQYYFKPVRELPTGRGFADFVYIPKPEYKADYPALVVELKWNKTADTALQQIKERKYPQSLEQYTGNILLVGINYDKKTKEHSCVIENDKKQ
mgnify:CR=1 FL=1